MASMSSGTRKRNSEGNFISKQECQNAFSPPNACTRMRLARRVCGEGEEEVASLLANGGERICVS